jgi:hypothetical protein
MVVVVVVATRGSRCSTYSGIHVVVVVVAVVVVVVVVVAAVVITGINTTGSSIHPMGDRRLITRIIISIIKRMVVTPPTDLLERTPEGGGDLRFTERAFHQHVVGFEKVGPFNPNEFRIADTAIPTDLIQGCTNRRAGPHRSVITSLARGGCQHFAPRSISAGREFPTCGNLDCPVT